MYHTELASLVIRITTPNVAKRKKIAERLIVVSKLVSNFFAGDISITTRRLSYHECFNNKLRIETCKEEEIEVSFSH